MSLLCDGLVYDSLIGFQFGWDALPPRAMNDSSVSTASTAMFRPWEYKALRVSTISLLLSVVDILPSVVAPG